MNITIEDISSVDKEVIISATRDDLKPKFDEAFKKYQGKIDLPGFRPGKVPISIVRKRFGKEIEIEEIEKFIQEVFEDKVVPEYEPVGESQMIDLTWENDELEAKFKIGARPEFELVDLNKIKVDQMVHDVTDQEVDEEIDRLLEQAGNWVETDESVTEKSKVVVNAIHLDDDGNPIEGEIDENQVIDMRRDEFASFSNDLLGKKSGDIIDVELGEEDQKDKFRLIVKEVQKLQKGKLTDEFVKDQTNEEAKNVDEFRSLIKSRIQDYYDRAAEDMFKNDVVENIVEKHDIQIPDVFVEQILNQYIQRVAQQNEGELPADFNENQYREEMKDRAERDASWYFINEKLQEKFDDIEIKPDDIDEYLAAESERYGISIDQMRNLFAQNPQQLESLRNSIRENKVFERLKEEIELNEISKDKYQKKHDKKIKAKKKAKKK